MDGCRVIGEMSTEEAARTAESIPHCKVGTQSCIPICGTTRRPARIRLKCAARTSLDTGKRWRLDRWSQEAKTCGLRQQDERIVEDNGDGTYTLWGYSVYGAIGQTGEPAAGYTILPIKTKADRAEVARIEKMIEDGKRRSASFYVAMGGNPAVLERLDHDS